MDRRTLLRASAVASLAAPFAGVAEANAQGLRRGGTLVAMATPEPRVLVPGVSSQVTTLMVGGKIHEGLLTFGLELSPMPGLARAWTVSEDGLAYVFTLQDHVVWHDGAPLTAEDVVFSIMQFHMELNPRVRAVLRNVESCVAVDGLTVAIRLREAFEPFLLALDATSCAIVPRHVYAGTDYRANPANGAPVGSGPFKLESWRRGESIRLVRHDAYWKPGRPLLDAIVYRIMPDPAQRAAALRAGEVQLGAFADIDVADAHRLRAAPNLAVETAGNELFAPICWVELNHRVAPLGDPRVRRALAMALDRDFVVNRIWGGLARPATSPIASSTRFHDPSVRLPGHDPAGAAALLDAAGHRAGADGTRFELAFMPLPYGDVWRRLGEYVQQALARIGVTLVVDAVDAAAWVRRLAAWDYALTLNFVYQWGDPSLGVERGYLSTNIRKAAFANTSGYANAQVDALFRTAREAIDPGTRRRAFAELQLLLVEDMPALWLAELAFPTIHDRRLRGIAATATGVHGSFDAVAFES
jgi:peptide/nickel transport system substrate-binding protein